MIGNIGAYSQVLSGARTRYLDDHISNLVDRGIAGKSPSPTTYGVFSTLDNDGSNYVRNVNLAMAQHVALTGIPVWNSWFGGAFNGIMVTPKHMMGVNHAYVLNEKTVRFVTVDNQVVERTVAASYQVADWDFRIVELDSDLPDTIKIATFFDQYERYFAPDASVAGLRHDQFNYLSIYNYNQIDGGTTSGVGDRANWYTAPVNGDSGHPFIWIADNTPIYFGVTTSNAGNSVSIMPISDIQDAIQGYSLRMFDTANFQEY